MNGEPHTSGRPEEDRPQSAAPDEPESEELDTTGMGRKIDELKELGDLRDRGALTEEEFEARKKRILAS